VVEQYDEESAEDGGGANAEEVIRRHESDPLLAFRQRGALVLEGARKEEHTTLLQSPVVMAVGELGG
jgi:hypothetical protein